MLLGFRIPRCPRFGAVSVAKYVVITILHFANAFGMSKFQGDKVSHGFPKLPQKQVLILCAIHRSINHDANRSGHLVFIFGAYIVRV